MAKLEVVKGPNQGISMPLSDERIVMGRNADCGIVINLPAVSREHAVIRRINGQYFIEDLKSRNKTFLNNQEVLPQAPMPLRDKDRIKICDSEFLFREKVELPEHLRAEKPAEEEEEESTSTIEATIAQSSKQILETQPSEKLAFLLAITCDLTQTITLDQLLPKIADSLFQVFKQADRCFIILGEEGTEKLIPKVIKTRRAADESDARFSRRIVRECLEKAQAVLSGDATTDKRFDLSQSIADCRIRSVMVAPLTMRSTGKAFGVIQLDTQDQRKKFTQDDLKLLLAVAGQAAIALENARLHENLVARAGLERDLKLAHQVQISFLPKKPPQLAGYQFYAHYESAQEVGGDYYDFIPLPGPRLGVMLGDVAGKGVPAALLMAKVSSDARFCALTEPDLAQAVYKLNEQMQEAGMLDRFVTLSAGLLDPVAHRLTFVNAGHMPPLIYRHMSGKIEEAVTRDQTGFPLGVADGVPYDAVTLVLNPGDLVVIFTDGITEAPNKHGEQFEEGARVQAAMLAGPVTAEDVGKRLLAAVKQHTLGCKQHDDITVVCFGRTQ